MREIARASTERLIVLEHAHMRMLEREITLQQVVRTLKNGEIVSDIKWDTTEDKGWKCNFRHTSAGVKINAVAKLVKKEEIQCLIVTVW